MTTIKTLINSANLMTLEAYAKFRESSQPEASTHRRLRSVQLGENLKLQFEDERTIRRQIQEMLHIEKVFDEEGIQSEVDAYDALVPDGSNWKATMLIEYPDVHERKRELARLIGVEDRMFVEVEGHARAARRHACRRGSETGLRSHPLPGATEPLARNLGQLGG